MPIPLARRRAAANSAGERPGFTLVELMVVATIIGILATIAVPHFRAHLLQARLDAAVPYLLQIQAKQRMYRQVHGQYCCDKKTTSEQNMVEDLGLNIAEEGDFCFIFVCQDATLCQTTTSAGFIAAAETGDTAIEFEVWALLREGAATSIDGPNGATCTTATDKRPGTGWAEPSTSTNAGREGQAVILRYPPPPNGVDAVVDSRSLQHVWTNGVSVTDASTP